VEIMVFLEKVCLDRWYIPFSLGLGGEIDLGYSNDERACSFSYPFLGLIESFGVCVAYFD
jgi:hypothetical protein